MSVFDNLASYTPNIRGGSSFNNVLSSDKVEDLILKLEREGFNLTEMRPIIEADGNQLIVSGAGSGKTTVLLFIVQKDILTGAATRLVQLPNSTEPVRVVDKVLVCTFLNSGAKDLQNRLGYWQNKLGYMNTADSVVFSTLHAEFLHVLREVGISQGILSAEENRRITRKVCEIYDITNSKTNYMSKEDYKNIEGIFTYCRNRLDDKKYAIDGMEQYNISPVILQRMIDEAKVMRRNMGKIDFEDVQELLLSALQVNPALQELVKNRYSIMYIDEFQDTSQIQYEILKYYAVGCKRIVAIGDDDQTIYTWRGSDIDIILNRFSQDFKPNVYKLGVNYRCPENILQPVVSSISLNQFRLTKDLKAYNQGGELNVYALKGIEEYWDLMSSSLEDDVRSGKSVAVLVRTNFDGLVPAMLLETHHVFDYSISSDSMTADRKLPQDILSLVSLFLDRDSKRLKDSFDLLVGKDYQAKHDNKILIDVLKANHSLNFWNIDKRDLSNSAPKLCDVRTYLENAKNSGEPNAEIIAFVRLLDWTRSEVYSGDNDFCINARNFIDCIKKVISLKKFNTVEEFDTYMGYANRCLKAHINKENTAIQIATVHEAKGKEWDSVYIWNDIYGVFPSCRIMPEDIELYEEERRVHYIAWTRARQKLTVLTQMVNSSEFLNECDVNNADIHTTLSLKTNSSYQVEDLFA